MGIPVVIIRGILESGKTTFLIDAIKKGDFGNLGRTFILSQEEGEVEYNLEEMQKLKDNGINEQEFLRGKEQIKSAFIMARESTSSQMLLFGKHMIFFDEKYSIEDKLKKFEKLTIDDVNKVIKDLFDFDKIATSTVGPKKTSLNI